MKQSGHLIPHLAALAVIGGCIALTLWQLERADEKRQILARWHDRTPLLLDERNTPVTLPQPVRVTGRWVADRQLLIDNKVRDRMPGVQVLTPLELGDGRVFLVNRGWAPWPSRQARMPDPEVTRLGSVELRGVLNRPPGVGLRVGESAAGSGADWPRLMAWFDAERARAWYGPVLQPGVIQLDPSDADHLTGDPWQVVTFGPDRHLGYALTWGTIAGVVLVIWIGLGAGLFRYIKHRVGA